MKIRIKYLIMFYILIAMPILSIVSAYSQDVSGINKSDDLKALKGNTINEEKNVTNNIGKVNSDQKTIKVQKEDILNNKPNPSDEDISNMLLNEKTDADTINPKNINSANDSKYTLGTNDFLEINVMRHPEVSGKYMINSEGNIQYEFVGDIHIAGLTKEAASDVIKNKLSTYIISPDITVKILEYNSKVVYVIGEVRNPGIVYMRGDTITIREALIKAGLPLLTAKGSKSRLITPEEKKKPIIKRVNIDKLLYEGDLRQNLVMKPGDTLYIPPTFMTRTMRAIQPIASPIGTAASTGRTVTTGF